MAFKDDGLTLLGHIAPKPGGTRSCGFFFYRTADDEAAVEGANYFNAAAEKLGDGSIVKVLGTTNRTAEYLVGVSAAGVVTLTQLADDVT